MTGTAAGTARAQPRQVELLVPQIDLAFTRDDRVARIHGHRA
jgi:hypothetical protein